MKLRMMAALFIPAAVLASTKAAAQTAESFVDPVAGL
jgi:hypothetical protein